MHTSTVEKTDPTKAVTKWLMSYRAAPHKTTGKSPNEMWFCRKMKTGLPQMSIKKYTQMVEEARKKQD